MAAQSGHTDVVSTLLDRGVDINTADKVNMHTTVLSIANSCNKADLPSLIDITITPSHTHIHTLTLTLTSASYAIIASLITPISYYHCLR